MRELLDAWQAAEKKMDNLCSSAKLEYTFYGDQYPMQMVVQDKEDNAQMSMEEMQEERELLRIIYKFDSASVWWKPITEAEITNDLNNKLVSAFKSLCNAYAHYRYSEYLEGR